MLRKISRRRFVNGTIGHAVVVPLIHLGPAAATQPASRIAGVDRRTLSAAVDVIVPAEGRMPAASAAGVVRYIERLARADEALERLLLEGLRAVGAQPNGVRHTRFDRLPVNDQVAVLANIESTNTPANFFVTLRDLVYEGYYTQPDVQKLIGYTFRSGRRRTAALAPFDERLVARVRNQKATYRPVS